MGGETVAGTQRAVTVPVGGAVREVAPAEVVNVTEIGPNLPAEQMQAVIKAAPPPQPVMAAPVMTVAAPVTTVAAPVTTVMAAPPVVTEVIQQPVTTYAAPTVTEVIQQPITTYAAPTV